MWNNSADVYPVEDLKRQIDYFRMRRDSNITQIARKIISKGTFDSFRDLLDAVEVQLKGLGDNYLPLARELAAIWSGVRNPPSLMLLVDRLKIKGTNKWISAVESGRLEDKVYKILVSVEMFNDHGMGARRSFLSLTLYDEMGEIVERHKLFDGNDHQGAYKHRSFGKRDKIVTSARAGYTYKLEYMACSNEEYFKVEGLICKIIPMSTASSSYRMRDIDGEDGLYIGSTNADKDAHGEGSLEYDNGNRFVGYFKNGTMVDGVLYRGSHIRQTMKRGKWTNRIDDVVVEKFPSNMIVYDHAGDSSNIELKRRMKRLDELYESGKGDRHSSRSGYGRFDSHYDQDDSVYGKNSSRYRGQSYNRYRGNLHSRGNRDDYSMSHNSRSGWRASLDDSNVPYHIRSQKSLMDDDLSLSRRSHRLPIIENIPFARPSRSIDDDVYKSQTVHNKGKAVELGHVFPDMRGARRHNNGSDRRGYYDSRHNKSGYDSDDIDTRLGSRRGKDVDIGKDGGVFPDMRDRRHGYGETSGSRNDRINIGGGVFPDTRGMRRPGDYDEDSEENEIFAHTRENRPIGSPYSSNYSRDKYPFQGRDDSSRYSYADSRRSNHQQHRDSGLDHQFHHRDFFEDEKSHHSRYERPHSGHHSNVSAQEEKYLDEMFGMNMPRKDDSNLSRHSRGNGSSPLHGRTNSRDSSYSTDRPNLVMAGQKSNSLGISGPKTNSLGLTREEMVGKKSHSLGILHEEFDVPKSRSLERSASSDTELILPKYIRPYILHVPKLQKKLNKGGAWIGVTQTGYLEDKVKSLMISVDEFLDEKKKSNLGIALYDANGEFVVRCNIFGNRTKTKGNFRLITNEENIVAKARPGYFYQLQVAVNTGSTDVLQVKSWICKIFPASTNVPIHQMVDNDGDKGYYFGPVNLQNKAHGKGILEYENGCTFVGLFAKGMLMKGAYYKVDTIRATMQSSKWNDQVDRNICREYPQCIQTLSREVRPQNIHNKNRSRDYEIEDESSIDQVGSMCC